MMRRPHDDTQAGTRRLGRLVVGVLLLAALALAGPPAWSYWTSSGDGTGSATTATLEPPTDVEATFTEGLTSVGVSWTAPTAGVTPLGYYITRTRQSDMVTAEACASSPTSLVTGLTCDDEGIETGTYRYTVTAVYRSWTAVSGSSGTVNVITDTAAPVVTVTSVNNTVRTFPYVTTGNVTSIGGACGTAAGDLAPVTVLVNGSQFGPVNCSPAGAWTLGVSWTTDGTRIVSATQADEAGNTGTAPPQSVHVDKVAPRVLGVSATVADGSYRQGQVVPVTVTFSEPVTVTGTLRLTLRTRPTNPKTTAVDYTAGSGTETLTFNYTVAAGDTSADLDYAATNSLSGGTIRDVAARNANRTLPAPGASGSLGATKDIVIDTTLPTVTGGVSSPLPNGQYGAGQVVPVTVTFSEAVTVSGPGTPQLTLATGSPPTTAVGYTSGSEGTTLTFAYTVAPGHTSVDLDYVSAAALALNDGAITDAAGNAAVLTMPNPGAPGSLGANKSLVIDTAAPTVTGVSSGLANGSYRAGQAVPVTVTFSEPVTVSGPGTPQLALVTGDPATTAVDYTSGSGTTALAFTYTVVAGNTSDDLDYESAAALDLSGGTITDLAGNDAALTLANPGAVGSLGGAKALVIDTTPPIVTVTSVNGVEQAFPYATDENVTTIGGTCGTAAGDAATVAPRINGAATAPATATCSSGEWTLTLGTALSTSGTRTLSATQVDAAGNTGTAPTQTVVIDTTPPTVSSIVRAGASQLVNTGPLSWTVTFSEPVTGVAASNFDLVTSGLTGTPTISGVAPDGSVPSATWTVSTGMSGVGGSDSASIGLNLTSPGLVVDAVGNALGITPFTGQAYGYDTAAPTVTEVSSTLANGSYRDGQVVPVTVTFSEPVTVSGAPQLTLATGPSDTKAVGYNSGSGGATLTFEYTVEDGENTADLDYATTTSLAFNGGAITDAAGNLATRTLPAPGEAGSLGAAKSLVIDTTPPEVVVSEIEPLIFLGFIRLLRVSGTAEVGSGPVTVYLCSAGPSCDATSATATFTNVAVETNGTWLTGWSGQGQGTWYASATLTDAAGNVGTSEVRGPINN